MLHIDDQSKVTLNTDTLCITHVCDTICCIVVVDARDRQAMVRSVEGMTKIICGQSLSERWAASAFSYEG